MERNNFIERCMYYSNLTLGEIPLKVVMPPLNAPMVQSRNMQALVDVHHLCQKLPYLLGDRVEIIAMDISDILVRTSTFMKEAFIHITSEQRIPQYNDNIAHRSVVLHEFRDIMLAALNCISDADFYNRRMNNE